MSATVPRITMASISKYFIFCLPHISELSMSFGTTSKLEELDGGESSSCMSFMGLEWVTYDSFHWKQTLFGKSILENFVKKIKIWPCPYTLDDWD